MNIFSLVTRAFTQLLQQMNGPFVISIIGVCIAFGMVWAFMERHEIAWTIVLKGVIIASIALAIVGGALTVILAG